MTTSWELRRTVDHCQRIPPQTHGVCHIGQARQYMSASGATAVICAGAKSSGEECSPGMLGFARIRTNPDAEAFRTTVALRSVGKFVDSSPSGQDCQIHGQPYSIPSRGSSTQSQLKCIHRPNPLLSGDWDKGNPERFLTRSKSQGKARIILPPVVIFQSCVMERQDQNSDGEALMVGIPRGD
jgi:hypothetical protein